jgi:hypothetical protein
LELTACGVNLMKFLMPAVVRYDLKLMKLDKLMDSVTVMSLCSVAESAQIQKSHIGT